MVSESGADCGFTSKSSVMVIENEENVFEYQRMLVFASACEKYQPWPGKLRCGPWQWQPGHPAGLHAWLNQYRRVYCAFDYDAGGLQMFATMAGYLGEKSQLCKSPGNLESWLLKFRKAPANTERFTMAIQ
ncbi:hypothetical protein ACFPTY_20140 [Halomonas beimenensis]|uniref:hypothetical protein n=1 Tax=Halomonas beimenensis TaxID=475662 RepID=UPI00360C1DAE